MSTDKWFSDQARLGNMFSSHNTTAGAVTVISATATGLIISNPLGSGKDLVMKEARFSGTTLAAAATIGLVVSPTRLDVVQTGTAAVIHNNKLAGSNSGGSVANALSIATLLTTPVWYREMGKLEITANVSAGGAIAEMNGDTIVPPGFYIALATLTTARTGMASFTWAEVAEGAPIT